MIIGTSLFRKLSFLKTTTTVFFGAVIYKLCVGIAIKNFEPRDMKLITAVLFLVIFVDQYGEKKEGERKCLN